MKLWHYISMAIVFSCTSFVAVAHEPRPEVGVNLSDTELIAGLGIDPFGDNSFDPGLIAGQAAMVDLLLAGSAMPPEELTVGAMPDWHKPLPFHNGAGLTQPDNLRHNSPCRVNCDTGDYRQTEGKFNRRYSCLLYTSPSPRD